MDERLVTTEEDLERIESLQRELFGEEVVKSEPYIVEPISKAESDILLNIAENGAHLDDVFWEQFKVEINRLVHRGYAYFTDTSGGGPGYTNRTVTLTQKGIDALAMWRKESGARLYSAVADVLKSFEGHKGRPGEVGGSVPRRLRGILSSVGAGHDKILQNLGKTSVPIDQLDYDEKKRRVVSRGTSIPAKDISWLTNNPKGKEGNLAWEMISYKRDDGLLQRRLVITDENVSADAFLGKFKVMVKSVTVYHGTTARVINRIIQEGIRPSSEVGVRVDYEGRVESTLDDGVYVSTNRRRAETFGRLFAESETRKLNSFVVLKVRLPKGTRYHIDPDEEWTTALRIKGAIPADQIVGYYDASGKYHALKAKKAFTEEHRSEGIEAYHVAVCLASNPEETGGRLQSLVAMIKHLPGKHDQKTHAHVVAGSKTDAEAFVSDSAVKETFYHGAKYTDPQEAMRVSHPEETAAVFGRGIYLTDDPKETKQYGAQKFAVKVKTKNPLVLPTDASSFQKLMDETPASQRKAVERRIRDYNAAVRKKAGDAIDDTVKMEVAQKLGYDAIVVLYPNRKWLVVPDASQILVVEKSWEITK